MAEPSGPPRRQCGRCRLLFDGDPTLEPQPHLQWWLARPAKPPCFPSGRQKPALTRSWRRSFTMTPEGVLTSSAPPGRAQAVWRRTFQLADPFDQDDVFTVVFDVLRTARHEVGTLRDALELGHRGVDDDPVDPIARRACALLERAIGFMGSTVHGSLRD